MDKLIDKWSAWIGKKVNLPPYEGKFNTRLVEYKTLLYIDSGKNHPVRLADSSVPIESTLHF